MKKNKIGIFDIILLVLSLALLIGSVTFFGACSPMENGNWMNCHWANVAITALASVLAVISLAGLLIPNRVVRAILDIIAVLVSVVTALVPGTIVTLCMMPEMHCRAVMRPITILFSSLIAITAIAGTVINFRKKDK